MLPGVQLIVMEKELKLWRPWCFPEHDHVPLFLPSLLGLPPPVLSEHVNDQTSPVTTTAFSIVFPTSLLLSIMPC